ncbi:MAG TPA: ABC transporter substrate-binding protein [Thermodesulfobacteriota bacterium]|nr:ABC transporter substrate-binding protein [Thermodesulfobacteriota bacterium]
MATVQLTLAISDYDHVRDLTRGEVRAAGIELVHLDLQIEEIFHRFTKYREWDVSEMSLAKYCALVSQGDTSVTAIPVFPSRAFRLSSIYVRRGGPVRRPEDLKGKRVGLPEWAQTAAVYTRGYLVHEVGLSLADIEWVQAGVNEAGRAEKVALELPAGVRCRPAPDKTLNGMLLSGEVDAIMTAHPPDAFVQRRPEVVRLFPDYVAVEEAYWRKTGIYPIMHIVALRRQVLERHPWVAMNLFKAFEEAKRRSQARALDVTATRFPIPWVYAWAERARELFGDDFFPYGIEPNRRTLEAFLRFAHEQGVCRRLLRVEELFPEELRTSFRV